MQKAKRLGLVFFGIFVIFGLFFISFSLLKPKVAGLFIETNPSASVLINGQEVGKTPYRTTADPGEIVILLIPEAFNVALVSYETKVALTPGVETVIRHEFGENDESASGEIISFERVGKSETSLAVVTDPDSSQITIDGADSTYTPYKTSSVIAGEHTLVVSSQGYLDRVVRVKTHKGYKLTAFVKLGKTFEGPKVAASTPTISPDPKIGEEGIVEILPTSLGYLRVRETPSTLGAEIGRVKQGEVYPLVMIDARTGWFKIEFEEGAVGWISNQYAKIVEEENPTPANEELFPTVTSTPLPSPTITPQF